MAKTQITPKQLYENRNTSDVFPRLVIMGLLRVLNLKLVYTQIWEDNNEGIQNVTVPFFFDFTGGAGTSEKFILDNYMNWSDDECTSMGIKKMNGDYKPIPYGVLSLESTSIDSGNISNRFVMGQYQKKIDGELKSYVSFLYSIPLSMSFNVNITCDTINTMWKIEQAYREFFYKNKTFHFNYKGTVCSARVGYPESLSETKTASYTMGGQLQTDGADIKVSFSLQVETYQPVFDPYTEMEADNNIKNFTTNINLKPDEGTIKNIKATKLNNLSITSEEDILLEWKFYYHSSDLLSVDILYQEEGDDSYYLIESNIDNHNYYHLNIKNDINDNPVLIDVIIPHNEKCIVVNQPILKFYCDPETNIVSSATCTIVDKGFIITDLDYINAIVSYENSKNKLIEKEIKINLLNGAVNEENPVDMKDFVYTKDYSYKNIKLYVRDHNNHEIIDSFQQDDEWIKVF